MTSVQASRSTTWHARAVVTTARSTTWTVLFLHIQHYLTIRPTTAKMYLGAKPIKAIYRGKDKIWESV